MAVSSQPRRVGEYFCQIQATPAVPPCDCFPGRQNRGAHVRDIPMESAARKVQARPQGGRGPLCISSANQLCRCRQLSLKEQPIETTVATCGQDAKPRAKQQGAQRNNNEHSDSRQGQEGSARALWSMQTRSTHAWQLVRENKQHTCYPHQTLPGTRSYARCEASPCLILVSVDCGLLADRLIPSGQGGIWWRRRYGPVRGRSISNASCGPRPRSLRCQE